MKQNYLINRIAIFLMITMAISTGSLMAQLSGSYTINPSSSASSTNYQDWASAISDLLNGSRSDGGSTQGPGIGGNVTFTVSNGVYSSVSINFTSIPGSNPSRRVTFKSAGGNSSSCILKNASSSSVSNDFVLYMNGADYVTFENIGFERTGNSYYATVVQLGNDANGNIFKGCLFKGKKAPSNSTGGFTDTIGSCIDFAGNADSTQILNSRLLYGYNGIFCTSSASDNLISGCIIDSNGSSGVYMTGQTRLRIIGNTFNMGDFGPNLGHYTSYGMRIETSPGMIISKNKIFMSAVNGQVVRGLIIASTTSTASAPTLITNNWIVNSGGSGDCTGLAIYACNYLNFFNNNVLITSALTSSAAYYQYPQYTNSFIRLVNNNFINKGAGFAVSASGTNVSNIDSMDYNNLYSSGTYIAVWNGSNYTSLSGLKSVSLKDSNSLSVDPGFINNYNLHVSNIGLNSKALKYGWVLDDIDNELRDTATPDIGADEFFPIAKDVGITSVDSPMVFCAGKHNIKVKFQNFGIDTVKSVQIQWQINGSAQTPYNWTGTVPSSSSSASLLLGSFTFASNTPYTIKAWTVNPNSVSDGKKSNDTLTIIRYAGMTGTYLISDSLNGDFKSFNSAIAAFTSRGICGPIKFRVAPGIYNEQITLLQLPGMGSSSPITFESMDSDSTKVIVTLPSTTATGNNNAAIQLRGADYIHFKGITFERTGANSYAHVVHILNGSNHNSFKHCQMIGLKLGTANANNIWSDQGVDNNNEFHNNYVKFGNTSMLFIGTDTTHEEGTVLIGNVFDSAYNSLVQIQYNDGIVLEKNTFRRVITPIAGNFSLHLSDCDQGIILDANRFFDQGSESSMLLTNCNASSGTPGVISNNVFSKASGKGISLDAVDYQTIAFNSMYMSGPVSTNSGIYSAVNTSSNIVMKNNNIMMEGGQAVFIPIASQVNSSDHNNFYIKGGSFAYWGGNYTNLTDLQMATGMDGNSKSVNPLFKSSLDLHIVSPMLKGAGTAVSGISTDMDGEIRNTTNPDIGADEFRLLDNDAGIVEMSGPLTGACAGVHDIEIVIRNYGGMTLTSADIDWSVLGIQQTTYKWTGSLQTNELDTFIIGSHNFVGNLNPKFMFWTSIPNGQTDSIAFNDSLILNKSLRSLPVANAGADVSICSGSNVVLGPNPGGGMSYRWTDLGNNLLGTNSKLTVSPNTQSSYVLEVTNTTFGCKKKDTVVVSVNPVPNANAGTDKVVCYGSSVQVGEATQTGFNYSWSSIPSGFSSNISNPTIMAYQNSRYVLFKEIVATGCYDYDTVMVSISLRPTPLITGTGASCENQSFNYITNNNSGNSYVWIVNGGTLVSGQNTPNVTVLWNSPGSGLVRVVESNSIGCKDTAGYAVTVYKNPVARFNFTNVCDGDAISFKDSSDDANSSVWSFGDNKSSFLKNPTHLYDSSNTYQVRLIVIGSGNCSDTLTKQAEVYPLPIANFNFTKIAAKTYAFNDQSSIKSGSVLNWTWTFGDGNSSTSENVQYQYDDTSVGRIYNVELCVTSDKTCSSCITKQLTVTEIADLIRLNGVKVYPNPSNGVIHLKSVLDMQSISVFNLLGQEVHAELLGTSEHLLDLSTLTDGVYVVKVTIAGVEMNTTMIIQH